CRRWGRTPRSPPRTRCWPAERAEHPVTACRAGPGNRPRRLWQTAALRERAALHPRPGRPTQTIAARLAQDLAMRETQVPAAMDLRDGGATVPFLARYRKEVTGNLDDIQLREPDARLAYLRELEERRATVLKSIDEQGKLSDVLRAAIEAAD